MDSFEPTFFDKREGEDAATSKVRIRAYIDSIQERTPYEIISNMREGWSQYKKLKYVRKVGWWKDAGLHKLARNMVTLGLKDAPVLVHKVQSQWPTRYASLYWMAAHDVTETDARGIFYYRHNDSHWSEQEDDEE